MISKSLILPPCFLVLLQIVPLMAGSSKASVEWKTATVVDTSDHSYASHQNTTEGYDPYRQRGQPSPYPATSTTRTVYTTTFTYLLDAGDMVYTATITPRWRWSKVPAVTVNGTVKFALEGNRKLLMVDDEGREYKLDLIRRVKKN